MTNVLQREIWNGTPTRIGEWFIVAKSRRTAKCTIFTHQFGWELRLLAGEELLQSQVCRTQDEVFDTGDAWKAALLEKGWT